mmetsp:Transcript_3907/g.11071  ORF Transcript_3907/g.11071 Transcript_3907/m.11071 type:complete len:217 (-) Transcript_3907:857-1507(-)
MASTASVYSLTSRLRRSAPVCEKVKRVRWVIRAVCALSAISNLKACSLAALKEAGISFTAERRRAVNAMQAAVGDSGMIPVSGVRKSPFFCSEDSRISACRKKAVRPTFRERDSAACIDLMKAARPILHSVSSLRTAPTRGWTTSRKYICAFLTTSLPTLTAPSTCPSPCLAALVAAEETAAVSAEATASAALPFSHPLPHASQACCSPSVKCLEA